MGITRFVLKRPVTVLMALFMPDRVRYFLLIFNATLEQMPDMDQPMMIIMANYSGASRRIWMNWSRSSLRTRSARSRVLRA